MGAEGRALLDLARSILDGVPIDWAEVERSAADEDERFLMAHMRTVADIVQVHQRQQISGGPRTQGLPPIEKVDQPLRRWGPLELLARIGAGSSGEVYRAREAGLDREVALKLLHEDTSGGGNLASAVIEEGRLLARVRHSNVAAVYGSETHDGRAGFWMEYVSGHTLEDLLRERGMLGSREAGLIGLDLCRALAAVHRAGLVHRDVKARNVMREEGGRIVLMDFGAGKDVMRGRSDDDHLISGTPLYMAPELLRGERATVQADIYGLGVLLFHLVTGSYPVRGTTLKELREAHLSNITQSLGELRPELSPAFVRVVERALAREPGSRFASMAAMEQALATSLGVDARSDVLVKSNEAARRRGRRWLYLTLAVSVPLMGILLGALFLRDSKEIVATAQVTTAAVPTVPAESYTVDASFFRGASARERLTSGDRVRVGDALSLEFRASRDLYVYVVNEDDDGVAVLLFPLEGNGLSNPLKAELTNLLPGDRDGRQEYWQVTSAGGREHFLVLASHERLAEFEKETVALLKPEPGRPLQYAPISGKARAHLRGVTGLIDGDSPRKVGASSRLFDLADLLESRSEVTRGVWVRRLDLENPAP